MFFKGMILLHPHSPFYAKLAEQTSQIRPKSGCFEVQLHRCAVCPTKRNRGLFQTKYIYSLKFPSSNADKLSVAEAMENGSELGCTRNLSLPNKSGENLVGIFEDTGSKDVVILCHGFRSNKNSYLLSGLATALAELGISSFRFDFSGNGESEGNFAYGNYWKEADDLHSVVQFWNSGGRHVQCIIGHSKGGNVVLLYAAKYGDVPNVINISGRFDLEKGISERLGKNFLEVVEEKGFLDVKDKSGNVEYRVTKESLWDRLNTDMKDAVSRIPETCRLLTIHGSEDEIIPASDAHLFAKFLANHRLIIVEGANHGYAVHRKELTDLVLQHVKSIPSR